MEDTHTLGNGPRGRRRIWAGAIALALFALYLCFGLWGVPAIARALIPDKASEALGREVTLEDAAFNPLTLEMRLMGLAIAGRPGESEPLLRIERCSANVQIASLLPNRIELKSVVVDGATANVAIEEDGSLSVRDILDRLAAAPKPGESEPAEMPKARVRSLDISNVAIAVADRRPATPYEERLVLESLVGSDIGTFASALRPMDPEQPDGAALVWDFRLRAALDSGGRIEARGGALGVEPWRFAVSSTVDAFDLASLQPFVGETVAAQIAGAFAGRFEVEATLAQAGPEARVKAEATLTDLAVSDAARRYVDIPRIAISGIAAEPLAMRASIGSVVIDSPGARVARLSDGSIGLPQFVESAPAPPLPQPTIELEVSLAKLALNGGSLELTDASLASPFETRVEAISFELSDLLYSTFGDKPAAKGQGRVSANLLSGSAGADFRLASLAEGPTAEARWDGLQLAPLQPYLDAFANATARKGAVSGTAKVSAQDARRYRMEAQLDLVDLEIAAKDAAQPAFQLRRLIVDGATATPEGIGVSRIALTDPSIRARITESGIDLLEMLPASEATSGVESQPSAEAVASAPASLPTIVVDAFEIQGGRAEIVNTTLVSAQRNVVEQLTAKVSELSTAPGAVARFDVSALLDKSARIAASGHISPLDPKKDTELTFEVAGHDLTATSAYWETYVGRKLDEGQFDIASGFTVALGQLDGSNRVVVQDLTLGERVESDRALGLPVGFAIKLLQDANRTIAIEDLPVSGDLNDPKVSPNPMQLVLKALGNLIAKAALSPFSLLSGLAGGREDLDTVSFAPAEAALSEDAREKAKSVASILQNRPGLRLKIGSALDESGERAALLDRALDFALARDGQAPAGALDLGGPFDAAAFEARVRDAFARLAEPVAVAAAADDTTTAETAEARRLGLLSKLRQWLRPDEGEREEAEPLPADLPREDAPAPGIEASSISLDEMKSALLAERPDLAIPQGWLDEIARERIQAFKTAILEAGDIEPSRVMVGEPSRPAGGTGSAIKLALSE